MRVQDFITKSATFALPRRPLNVPELIRRGAIFITHPHGEQGWETDRPDWDFSLITLQNVLEKNPPWVVDYKKYLSKDKKITQDFFNRLSDQKYNQILWSIKKLGIPDQVAFLDKQGVAEARQPVLNILRQALPDWPDYVLKDWLGTRVKDQEDLKNLRGWIDEIKKTVQPNSWQLHQKMPITFDMLDPKTRYFMKTKRQFGDRNPFMIPRDRERLEDAMRLVQEKGIENLPPVIMLQGPKGLELTEGWHRTMAAFRQHPDGFRINAWIGQRSQQVNEVQILAKVKGKGSEPGQIPKYGRPISPDQEVRYLGQQVGRMDRYQLWRDWLGGQLSYHVFDPESRTVVLTTFGSRYHRNPNSYIIHGLYAAPGNPVKAHQFYRNLIQDQGLTLISDRKQSPGGNRVWQRLEAYPDIEVYGFDTKPGEVMNFGAADAEMYAVPPRAAKDRESKYIAKNIRLVATAR